MTDPRERAERLFQAGRQEHPGRQLRERLLAIDLEPEQRRWWTTPRRFAVGSVAVALTTATLLLWPTRHERPRLAAEPATERSIAAVTPRVFEAELTPDLPQRAAPVVPAELPKSEPSPPVRPAATLPVELDSLRRVRTALSAGDSSAALDELDRYEREIRGTQLRAEAALLRIEAMSQRGERAAASRLAADFVERHPHSPLVDRARTFVSAPVPTGSNTTEDPIPPQ